MAGWLERSPQIHVACVRNFSEILSPFAQQRMGTRFLSEAGKGIGHEIEEKHPIVTDTSWFSHSHPPHGDLLFVKEQPSAGTVYYPLSCDSGLLMSLTIHCIQSTHSR